MCYNSVIKFSEYVELSAFLGRNSTLEKCTIIYYFCLYYCFACLDLCDYNIVIWLLMLCFVFIFNSEMWKRYSV